MRDKPVYEYSIVHENGKYGVVDRSSGNYFLKPVFDDVKFAFADVIRVKQDGVWKDVDDDGNLLPMLKYGLIDKRGEYLVEPRYSWIRPGSDLLQFQDIYLWGLMNKNGEIVVQPQFTVIDETDTEYIGYKEDRSFVRFRKETIMASKADVYLDEDIDYEEVAENMNFEDIIPNLGDGMFGVKRNGLWGVMNHKLDYVITPKYEAIEWRITDGLLCFKQYGLWGFVNMQGEVIIKPKFTNSAYFFDGVAIIVEGDMTL